MMWWVLAAALANNPIAEAVDVRATGDLDGALTMLRAHLAEHPEDATAWVEFAVTQTWSGNLVAAENAYARTLDLDPTRKDAAVGLARVTGWLGKRPRARRMLLELLVQYPDDTEILSTLARLSTAQTHHGAARRWWSQHEAAGGHEPERNEALAALRTNYRGDAIAGMGFGYTNESTSLTAHAGAAWAMSAKARLHGSWQMGQTWNVPREDPAPAHRGDLGITWTPKDGIWFNTSLHARTGWLGGGATLAVRAGPVVPSAGVVLLGSVTPEVLPVETTLNAGARVGKTWWGDARAFLLLKGPSLDTWTVSLRGGTSYKRVHPDLGASVSRSEISWWLNATGGVRIDLHDRVSLTPRVGLLYGAFTRVDGDVGVAVRF